MGIVRVKMTASVVKAVALSALIEDGEYEVTAEMLIHEDMDDERTMEEEEALQDQVEVMEELSNLEKVMCLISFIIM